MSQNVNCGSEDINDIFDRIAFSESEISDEAFQEGVIKGRIDGKSEGYHLGFHRGLELGTELGFYAGLTKVLMNNFMTAVGRIEKCEKIYSLLEKLMQLLNDFPRGNSQDVDLLETVNQIRSNYKKLNSLLKLNLSYKITPEMSF